MPQPKYSDLFGIGAAYNIDTDKFEISKAALEAAGINNARTAQAIEVLGAIVKNAHAWLALNQDEKVMAASRLDISSPLFRDNLEKSSFIYNMQFFGNYLAPIFDPDDL
jgi:hypothetical protein